MDPTADGAVPVLPVASGAAAGHGERTPGAILAAARAAQGLSIEDISRQLKLSAAQIKAIEADDHDKLPGPVFARGFIRSYARLLKLDDTRLLPPKSVPAPAPELPPVAPRLTVSASATPVKATPAPVAEPRYVPSIVAVDVHMMQDMPREAIEPNRWRRMPAVLAGIVALLLALAYYEFVLNAPAVPAVVPEASAPAFGAPGASPSMVPVPPATPATPTMAAAIEPAKAEAPVDTRIEAPIEPLKLKKSGDPVSDATGGLHFVFNGESWVEVRDIDGQVIFSRTNAAGTERRVQGKPPFSVVVGGAANVQLRYNGKPIELAAYVRDDVARLQVD